MWWTALVAWSTSNAICVGGGGGGGGGFAGLCPLFAINTGAETLPTDAYGAVSTLVLSTIREQLPESVDGSVYAIARNTATEKVIYDLESDGSYSTSSASFFKNIPLMAAVFVSLLISLCIGVVAVVVLKVAVGMARGRFMFFLNKQVRGCLPVWLSL